MPITVATPGAEASAVTDGITLNAPPSPEVGEVWWACLHTSDQNAMSMSGDWTQVAQGNGGGTTSRLAVFWHRYNGVTPSLVVTHSLGASLIGGIFVTRGAKSTGSPVNAVSVIQGGTDASIEIAAVTTTKPNCLLLCVDGAADDNNRSTLPTGFTAGFEDTAGGTQNCYQTTVGLPDGSVAAHYKTQGAAGGSGTFVDTQAASDPWASVLIAIEPEPTFASTDLVATGTGAANSAGTGISSAEVSSSGQGALTASGGLIYAAPMTSAANGDMSAVSGFLLGGDLDIEGSSGVFSAGFSATAEMAAAMPGAGALAAFGASVAGADLSAAGQAALAAAGAKIAGSDLAIDIGAGGGFVVRRKKVVVYDRV